MEERVKVYRPLPAHEETFAALCEAAGLVGRLATRGGNAKTQAGRTLSIARGRRCPIRPASRRRSSSGYWRRTGSRAGGRVSGWPCPDARSRRVPGRSRVRSVTSCAATGWSGRGGGAGAAPRMPSGWPSMGPPMRLGVRISKGTSRSARIAAIPHDRGWLQPLLTSVPRVTAAALGAGAAKLRIGVQGVWAA